MAQIQSQIDVLNEDFRRLNADRVNTPAPFLPVAADYGFEFKLACQDPNGNPSTGVIRKYTSKVRFDILYEQSGYFDETTMGIKMSSTYGDDPWPTDRYLNIWVCDFNGVVAGYSTFPADYATRPNVDGVVVDFQAFGRTGNVLAPYHLGRVTTHELGH